MDKKVVGIYYSDDYVYRKDGRSKPSLKEDTKLTLEYNDGTTEEFTGNEAAVQLALSSLDIG